MPAWSDLILLAVAAVIVFITMVLITKAAADIGSSEDPNLAKAHRYLTWMSVIGWILIALIILGIILFLVYGEELVSMAGGWVAGGIFVFLIIMAIIMGILSAISAVNIERSEVYQKNENTDHKKAVSAYKDTIIAACIALVLSTILVVGILAYFSHVHIVNREREKAKAEVTTAKAK